MSRKFDTQIEMPDGTELWVFGTWDDEPEIDSIQDEDGNEVEVTTKEREFLYQEWFQAANDWMVDEAEYERDAHDPVRGHNLV